MNFFCEYLRCIAGFPYAVLIISPTFPNQDKVADTRRDPDSFGGKWAKERIVFPWVLLVSVDDKIYILKDTEF